MNQWEMVGKAIEISVNAHKGQIDKGGIPYILHPIRVMLNFSDPFLMSIAVLHDVIEDTSVTMEDLKLAGFPQRIIDGVESMTHFDDEERKDYYKRLKKNPDALEVKVKDIFDNLSNERVMRLSQADRIRLTKKYGEALSCLFDSK